MWRFVIYEVEPQDPNAPVHLGGFNLFDWPPAEEPYFPWAMLQANQYWRGQNIAIEEAVIGGPCRVVRRVR